ncbi:MAG: DUF4147 domain-containing protein [Patescibacteria group bacterium]|nr:DUF4147 domain-containing protein [Patescibacteria group bacterium]
MKIRNLEELATTPARKDALLIAEAGLLSIDTAAVLDRILKIEGDRLHIGNKSYPLEHGGRLIAILVGKCAAEGAAVFDRILGGRIDSGAALGVGPGKDAGNIRYYQGTHPMPSPDNVKGTGALLKELHGLTANDTVLFLISGGGSTLLVQPPCVAERMDELVAKEAAALKGLFKSGASIQEINTLRKHMSLARGGFLAAAAHPARAISIIFSDVPGNDLEFIASGPTVKDLTTVKDAEDIMRRYGLDLDKECLTETPKDDEFFSRASNVLALSNATALNAMKEKAIELGYSAVIQNSCLTGEASEVGPALAADIDSAAPGTVILYCGETTVTIDGKGGKGGRNQQVALSALPHVKSGRLVISLASDGRDNGPHAGAIADANVLEVARSKKLDLADFAARNDSSTFFETLGDGLIETGDTGSNVSDLLMALAEKK